MDIYQIQDDVMNRQLNLEKLFKLNSEDKSIVMSLFGELVDSFYGEKGMNLPGGMRVDVIRASVLSDIETSEGSLINKFNPN